jgi:hypothetical protein
MAKKKTTLEEVAELYQAYRNINVKAEDATALVIAHCLIELKEKLDNDQA